MREGHFRSENTISEESQSIIFPHNGWRKRKTSTQSGLAQGPRGGATPNQPALLGRGVESAAPGWEVGWACLTI